MKQTNETKEHSITWEQLGRGCMYFIWGFVFLIVFIISYVIWINKWDSFWSGFLFACSVWFCSILLLLHILSCGEEK